MKSRKVISIMMLAIIILLLIITLGLVSNTVIIEETKKSNIYEIAQSANSVNAQENVETNVNEENKNIENSTINDEEASINTANIKETRTEALNEGNSTSSRSSVERQEAVEKNEEIYINTSKNEEQEYEEIAQYTKLEDVKISFNMDVSKTTGLSKEDFVTLVQNMRYDKTGILEKNAAWIWECCQKYSVNEIFVLGICGIESGWCSASQHQRTHNYSSLMSGGKLIAYPSDEAGFEAMIKLLGQKYLTPGASLYHGATITGVGRCYCNPTTWPKKVYTCMQQVFM